MSIRDILGSIRNPQFGKAVEDLASRAGVTAGTSASEILTKAMGETARKGGAEASETFRKGILDAMPDMVEQAKAQAKGVMPEMVDEARKHVKGALTEEAFDLLRKGTETGLVGAAAGLATGRGKARGAGHGALGGIGGGLIGAAYGKKFGLNPLAARMGGAAVGGATAGYLGRKDEPVQKYAGVTLDYYDDKGSLIKERYPTAGQLPDVIKTASVRSQESLPDEVFALVALDDGRVMRKYACYDPGTTAMSVMYFMEHKDKLPEGAVKVAAENLFRACVANDLLPPESLTKMAHSSSQQEALAVDITGQRPKAKVAAAPDRDEDYAVVMDDGERRYPIHDWDHIKLACDYWANESIRMYPEMRRQFAVKVASKAAQLGYPIDDAQMLDAAAPGYAETGHIKMSMEMRKVAFPGADNQLHRDFIDELVEKRAEMDPAVFAECVKRFDVMHGLDGGWDQQFLSPWESTYGLQKVAKVVWEQGADRVTDWELRQLAKEHSGDVGELVASESMIKEFEKDPVGIFNSLPLPQKKVFARLANDMASRGGSVMHSDLEG